MNDPQIQVLPPEPPAIPSSPAKSWWKQLLAPIGIGVAAIVKYAGSLKFLLFPLVKFLPVLLKTGGSMFLMIALYAQQYGWLWALGFVLLIFIHECGHLIAARHFGLKVGAPVFIPFMGALIALKEAPRNAWIEAVVGIGGPVAGSIGSLACHILFLHTGVTLWGALAYSGYFLNLFNLIPLSPLDGGRIATAISPWLWSVGFVALGWMIFNSPANSFLMILILVLAVPRLFSLFRAKDPATLRYFELTTHQRMTMTAYYFGLAALLFIGMNRVWELMHGGNM